MPQIVLTWCPKKSSRMFPFFCQLWELKVNLETKLLMMRLIQTWKYICGFYFQMWFLHLKFIIQLTFEWIFLNINYFIRKSLLSFNQNQIFKVHFLQCRPKHTLNNLVWTYLQLQNVISIKPLLYIRMTHF